MVNIRERKEENAMLARLIVRLLPVQAAIIADHGRGPAAPAPSGVEG